MLPLKRSYRGKSEEECDETKETEGKSMEVEGERRPRDNLLLFSVHSMTLHIPQDGCLPRRGKGRGQAERE